MDNEEDDVSKLPSPPSVRLQQDDSTGVTATTTVTNPHDDGSHSQCDVGSGAEVMAAQNEASEREGQLLEEGKEGDEDSIPGGSEVVAEFGVEGDESRDSREFVSAVAAAGENGRLTNGGDLEVVAAMVGAGGGEEEVICEERQVGEVKEKVEAAEEERVIKADVAGEMERKVEVAEERETNADLTEEREIRAEVVAEMEERFDMGEEMGITANVTEEMGIRTEVGEEMKTEEVKREDVAGETEIADEITADVTEQNGKEGEMIEGTGIRDEERKADVTEETEEEAEMVEKTEISDDVKAVDTVTEEIGIPEELCMANIALETATAEDTVVATAADEMEVGDDVAEEKEMQEETEVADDVAGRETEMGEETEMQEETEEAEANLEMDDGMEEADADVADETEKADMAEEKEGEELEEVAKTVGGKRKRGGKNAKPPGRVPSRKKLEEDVCFICFDGGELVLCDRRGCPKAYHPACVNRDEAFFQAKGRWNCGVIYSTANLAVVDLCQGTGSKTFSFAQHNVQVLQAHQVGLLCVI